MHKTIRHRVARYLTDRPGSVVYREEIEEDVQLTSAQITSSVRALQQHSPIGAEIQTVVTGNAWCYVPRGATSEPTPTDVATPRRDAPTTPAVNGQQSPTVRRQRDGSLPLTWQLREYLIARPGVVVHCDELVRHTGAAEYQVKVGVNNMRQGHTDIASHVEIVIAGQAWRYMPPGSSPSPSIERSDESPIASTASLSVSTNGEPRMFEEVGTTADGAIIIRDDDGRLYHATKM